MPFYVVVNNKLKSHEFDYLSKVSGRRLEPTLSPKAKFVDPRTNYSLDEALRMLRSDTRSIANASKLCE